MSFKKYINEEAKQPSEGEIYNMITQLIDVLQDKEKSYNSRHQSLQYKDRFDSDDRWSIEVYKQLTREIKATLPSLKRLGMYMAGAVESMTDGGKRMRS